MDNLPCENCLVLGICLGIFHHEHGSGWSPYGTLMQLRSRCKLLDTYLTCDEDYKLVSSKNSWKCEHFFKYFNVKMIGSIPVRKYNELLLEASM